MRQGSIIKTDFTPTEGREQSGYRPSLVVSYDLLNKLTGLVLVCPITNTKRANLLHVPLPETLSTTGFIMTEQVRVLDLSARKCKILERVPKTTMVVVAELIKASVNVSDDYDTITENEQVTTIDRLRNSLDWNGKIYPDKGKGHRVFINNTETFLTDEEVKTAKTFPNYRNE